MKKLFYIFLILLFSNFASALSLNDGLIANFHLDSLPAVVDSLGRFTGDSSAGVSVNNYGAYNNSYRYNKADGNDNTAIVDVNNILDLALTNYTYDFWINTTSVTTERQILSKRDGANRGWAFSIQDIGWDKAYVYHGATQFFTPSIPNNAVKFHVTVTYNRNLQRINVYYNGLNVSQENSVADMNVSDNNLWLGLYYNGAYPYDGWIDELSIWNRTLTAAEVLTLNNSFYPYNESGGELSFVPPTPDNGTANNTQVIINISCSVGNVSLWFDQNNPPSTIRLNNVSQIANWTTNAVSQGNYYYLASCDSGKINSSVRTWVYDTVSPSIIINGNNFFGSINNSNLSRVAANKNLSFNLSDNNGLYGFEINITDSNGQTVYYNLTTGLSVSNFSVSKYINFTNWLLGKYIVHLSVADTHTANKISDYKVNTNQDFNDKIKDLLGIKNPNKPASIDFKTTEGNNIKIQTELPAIADTTKEKDRYKFNFNFGETNERFKKFKVISDNVITYLPNSKYKAHFVITNDGVNGNWVDFETESGTPTVEKISDYEYEISFNTQENDLTFNSIGGLNTFSIDYNFNLISNFTIYAFNVTQEKNMTTFNCLVDNIAFIGINGVCITSFFDGNRNITVGKNDYINQSYIYNVSNNLNVTLYQTNVTIIFKELQTNSTITQPIFLQQFNDRNYTVVGGSVNLYTFSGQTAFFVNTTLYTPKNVTLTFTNLDTNIYYINLSSSFILNLIDEKTFLPLNTSSVVIKQDIFCEDGTTVETTINTSASTFSPTCIYNRIRYLLDFGTSGNYYRTILYETLNSFNISVYLIDLRTTTAIYDTFILDDLLKLYNNPSIYIKKSISSGNVIITSDFIDVEKKIGAYLIQNSEYILEVHSTNQPTKIIGSLFANTAGATSIRLYDISLAPTLTGFSSSATFNTGSVNNITKNIEASYNDASLLTSSVTWSLYTNQSVIPFYTVTTSENSVDFVYPISAYANSSIYGVINITYNGQNYVYSGVIQIAPTLNQSVSNIKYYFGDSNLNWFITLFLSIIALSFTIKTASPGALILCGLAALFIFFGLTTITWALLSVACFISLIIFIKEKSNEG